MSAAMSYPYRPLRLKSTTPSMPLVNVRLTMALSISPTVASSGYAMVPPIADTVPVRKEARIALPGPRGLGFLTVYILSPLAGAWLGGGLYLRLLRPAVVVDDVRPTS